MGSRSFAPAVLLALACGLGALVQPLTALGEQPRPARFETATQTFGTSSAGRPLTVVRRGRSDATIDVLVVGVIHGTETAGVPVVKQLMHGMPARQVRYWLVPSINPDGEQRGTRQNARGVDLNRNFSWRWRGGGRAWDVYYPGRARASEPETRALQRLVRRIRPDVTVWYHQHMHMTIRPAGRWRVALARTYARVSRLAMRSYPGPVLHGTASSWQHAALRRSAALVIELPAGRLPARSVRHHASAVRAVSLAAARDAVRSP